MVRIGKPKDIENYILVDNEQSLTLHSMNFQPCYIDKETGIYYKRTKELEEVMALIVQF